MKRRGWIVWVSVLAGYLAMSACGDEAQDPASQVRALIGTAETAAEQRDYSTLEAMLADGYTDDQGYDRQGISRLLRLTLMRNRTLHVLSVVRDLHVVDPETVRATVLVAVAARPLDAVEQLLDLRAELLHFDVRFVSADGSRWQVDQAAWRPASAAEFL